MRKIVALLSVIVLFSCNTAKTDKSVKYQVLTDSNYRGKKTESYEVIDNPADLKKVYTVVNDELVPDIDFANNRVVALFMGEKSSGGFSIGIESVREEKSKVIVKIKKSYPDGMASMALTQPYVIAKINTTKKIEFEE